MKMIIRLFVIFFDISCTDPAQYKNTDVEGVYNGGGTSFIIKKTIPFSCCNGYSDKRNLGY